MKKKKKLKEIIFSPALLACMLFAVIVMVLLYCFSEVEANEAVSTDSSATYTTVATEAVSEE